MLYSPRLPLRPPPRGDIAISLRPAEGAAPVEWAATQGLVPYERAVADMEALAEQIAAGAAPERVWLLEHPPIYTAGSSAKNADLLDARFPVHRTGRGGQFTYHGPGQRVAYVMLDLTRRKRDVRAYVGALEAWLIETLAGFGVTGERREERVGVWVQRPDKPCGALAEIAEDKVAAIGVRLRRWVSFHGIALNVAPDLSHFSGIAPCGVRQSHLGVTSLADLGAGGDMGAVDAALRKSFEDIFGPTVDA
jgi:lipoyl(octanoyl) transferase